MPPTLCGGERESGKEPRKAGREHERGMDLGNIANSTHKLVVSKQCARRHAANPCAEETSLCREPFFECFRCEKVANITSLDQAAVVGIPIFCFVCYFSHDELSSVFWLFAFTIVTQGGSFSLIYLK